MGHMSTRIGLIGDPHAAPEPLARALTILKQKKVSAIWCTGDIAGYGEHLNETAALLKDSSCRSIYGNHDQWHLERAGQQTSPAHDYLKSLPPVIEEEVAGRRLCMVHGSPPQSLLKGIRLLDEQGDVIEEEKKAWTERLAAFDHDVLIVGHTHQVFAEQLGHTLLINAGSTRFNHCCAVLSLPDMTIEWFALPGHLISYTWNWGSMLER